MIMSWFKALLFKIPPYLSAVSAVVFSAMISAVTYFGLHSAVEAGVERRLLEESMRIENAVSMRIDAAVTSLYNVRALFLSMKPVSQKMFREFIEKSELIQRFPALRGVGIYEAFDWDGEVLSSLMLFEPE